MATAGISKPIQNLGIFSNPWHWMGVGGIFVLWSLLWTRWFGVESSDYRCVGLGFGLLCVSVAVRLRWADQETIYLATASRALALGVRLALGSTFILGGLWIVIFFFLRVYHSDESTWKPGVTFLVLLTIAPPCFYAACRCFQHRPNHLALDVEEEVGLSLVLAGLFCVVGSFTLDLGGEYATEWDTMRMFLRVLAAVAMFASTLVLVSTRVRRWILTMLLIFHFTGVAVACLAQPPSPWLVVQLWTRIFRPYLEFMYFNNAYRYYSPDPNPASYLWFRVIYESPDNQQAGEWHKIPDLDEQGYSNYTADLEKQRFVAMTQQTVPTKAPPPWMILDPFGQLALNPIYGDRMALSMPRDRAKDVVGQLPADFFHIPFDPYLPPLQQITIPAETSQQLLASYARFVARKYTNTHAGKDWKVKSVKVYRVEHEVPIMSWWNAGWSPTDPVKYRPYYLGNYLPNGQLMEEKDPYLHWIVPIVRKDLKDPKSKVLDFARLHAGDPNWVRPALTDGRLPAWGPDDEELKLFQP